MFEDPAGPGLASVLAACDLSRVEGRARVDALVAAGRLVSWASAVSLEAMAAVTDRSPDDFAGDEVAFSLHLTRRGAENQVALARDLRDRLPAVQAALRDGRIDLVRARVFSDVLTPVADQTAREIADRLLPLAESWTSGQLRARLLKEILAADPGAAKERYRRSVEERRVYLGANDDSTASLSAIFLPPQRATAAYERVDALARGLKRDGDQRTLDQLRADVFCDLLSGIAITGAPIDRQGVIELVVPLETLTGQSDSPGHLNGYGPVIADIARQVAAAQAAQRLPTAEQALAAARRREQADARDREADLARTATVAGARLAALIKSQWRFRVHDRDGRLLYADVTHARPTKPETDTSATHKQAAPPTLPGMPDASSHPQDNGRGPQHSGHGSHAEGSGMQDTGGERQNTGGGPAPQILPCHAIPEAPGVLRIKPLPPHPPLQRDPTARYPSAPMRRWISARDGTCRAPGCTHPARTCDIDHTKDHADGGPTTDDNLGLLCRHHHRLKHETDHRLEQPEPGTFRWTTPHGHTHDTGPDVP